MAALEASAPTQALVESANDGIPILTALLSQLEVTVVIKVAVLVLLPLRIILAMVVVARAAIVLLANMVVEEDLVLC